MFVYVVFDEDEIQSIFRTKTEAEVYMDSHSKNILSWECHILQKTGEQPSEYRTE